MTTGLFRCVGIPGRPRVKAKPGCGMTFEELPGPGAQCPHCGCMWVKWLNYDEFKNPKKR